MLFVQLEYVISFNEFKAELCSLIYVFLIKENSKSFFLFYGGCVLNRVFCRVGSGKNEYLVNGNLILGKIVVLHDATKLLVFIKHTLYCRVYSCTLFVYQNLQCFTITLSTCWCTNMYYYVCNSNIIRRFFFTRHML